MDPEILQKLLQASSQGQNYAFATIIESTIKGTPQKTGAKMVVLEDKTALGTIGGGRYEKAAQLECLKAIKRRTPSTVTYDYFGKQGQSICGGRIKVFIEPFINNNHLLICGGGHIGLPLSILGKMTGFKITIIDNRKEFASHKRFRHADRVICGPYRSSLAKLDISRETYIMIVTQGNEFDFECLKTTIKSKAAYLGVISSLAKRVKFFHRLKALGFSDSSLKKINIPAGLDIGAQTPAEIAISIMAEIISVQKSVFRDTAKFKIKSKFLIK